MLSNLIKAWEEATPDEQEAFRRLIRKKRTPRNGTPHAIPLPEDFKITEDMMGWAKAKGYTSDYISHKTQLMRNWAQSRGIARKDWIATWRNCLMNERWR